MLSRRRKISGIIQGLHRNQLQARMFVTGNSEELQLWTILHDQYVLKVQCQLIVINIFQENLIRAIVAQPTCRA
jgi:hypothetical protein